MITAEFVIARFEAGACLLALPSKGCLRAGMGGGHGLTDEMSVALADVRTLDGAAAEMALDLDMIREMKAETRQSLKAVRKCTALQKSQQRREGRRAPILFLAPILRPLIARQ